MSNTEFYFLPSSHQLPNVVITLVHNVSLIGIISSTPVVLRCSGDASIVITDSDNIIISNLVFKECGGYLTTPEILFIVLKDQDITQIY